MNAKDIVRKYAQAIHLSSPGKAYDRLLEAIGDARVVLIGEASHGTKEFYRERAIITKKLILEKGFTAVDVDVWMPLSHWIVYHKDSYITGTAGPDITTAEDALNDFERFPRWMWRNEEVAGFVRWCKKYNAYIDECKGSFFDKVGFYGLDVYSMHRSAHAVLEYLEDVDREAARRASERYGCFERFGENWEAYAFAVRYGLTKSCEQGAVKVLRDLLRTRTDYILRGFDAFPGPRPEPQFIAELNATVVKDAEHYYRAMLQEDVLTWNIRDTHMVDTLQRIDKYLGEQRGVPSKLVVWAHNSHVGDARFTDMGELRGEVNIGQLCRQRFGDAAVFNVGFTTFNGTVTAASKWGARETIMQVNPGHVDSFERFFHECINDRTTPNYCLLFNRIWDHSKQVIHEELVKCLSRKLERAIGVIYRPDTERWSHYFHADIAKQFDAVIHIDGTTSVKPLEPPKGYEEHLPYEDLPETFPYGL